MADATFTVNGSEVTGAIAVTAGSTVNLAVVDTTGVRATIDWQFVGNHHSSATNPTITKAGIPLGSTASFTMPAGPNQAYMVRCRIDGGVDVNGRTDSAATYRAIIGVHNNNSVVPTCFGEERERNSTHGTTEIFNFLLNLQGSGVTNLYASDIHNDTTLTGDNLQEVLDGLDSDDIANASTVAGTTVSDALDTLAAADTTTNTTIANLGTDDIANESSVTGVTASDALDNLATQAITDHGALTGLGDVADHAGYLTLDGTRAMTGDLDMSENAVADASYLEVPTTEHVGSAKSVAGIGAVRLGFSGDIVMRNYDDDDNLVLFGISSSGGDVFFGAEAAIRAGSTNRTILRAYGGLYLQSGGPVNRMTITPTQATLEVPLSMGTNNIITNGLVDGVDVSAHASRHLPGGADPLPLGSNDISNESDVSGTTTSDALDNLATQTGTIVTDHGALTGLGDVADHTGYLTLDGTRAMTGALSMGANNITTSGLVDGVDVSAHASRHLPGGADPLALDASDINNDSSVSGANVDDALDTLNTAVGTIVTDHGGLTGLGDVADHPSFYVLDGSRALTGDVTVGTGGAYDLATTGARFAFAYLTNLDVSGDALVGNGVGNATVDIQGAASGYSTVSFSDTATQVGYVRYHHADDELHFGTSSATRWQIDSTGHLTPLASGSYDICSNAAGLRSLYIASQSSLLAEPTSGAQISGYSGGLVARDTAGSIQTVMLSSNRIGSNPILSLEKHGVTTAAATTTQTVTLEEILQFVTPSGGTKANRFHVELTISHEASALAQTSKNVGTLVVVWNQAAGEWQVDIATQTGGTTLDVLYASSGYTDHAISQYDHATMPTLGLGLAGGSGNTWYWHLLIRGMIFVT